MACLVCNILLACLVLAYLLQFLSPIIKSVVPGGAAFDDGRLVSGDLLVAVDDTPLHGLTQVCLKTLYREFVAYFS